MQTAYEHHQAGRFADAARAYQALLEQNPNDEGTLHLFGLMHLQCGYPSRAVELIRKAIGLRSDVAAFHSNLAEAYRTLKQYELAEDCCRTALQLQPDYPEAINNLGLALHDSGRCEEAVEQFDAALVLRPDFAAAWNNRGTSLLALDRTDEALESFRRAVRLDPNLALARTNLGQILTTRKKPAEGLIHCQEAVRLQPGLPAAHNNLGNAFLALESWEEARVAYAEALRLEPDLAIAYSNLGLTFQREGKIGSALPYFRRAVELAPQNAVFLQQLTWAYALDEDWLEAIPCAERRIRLEPEIADAHWDVGWAYQSDEQPIPAEAAFRRALALQPDHLDAWLNLGLLKEEQGLLTEAEHCYRESEARNPLSPLPLARRAVLTRSRLPDADRDRLRFHLYAPISPLLRLNCLFALAQVADARSDFAEAAACLEPGNSIARQQRRNNGQFYDPEEHTRFVDRLIAGFSPSLFERLHDVGDSTSQPVFVFGMPRSGTSLVEQVLASHSRVHGAGELPLAHRAMDYLSSGTQSSEQFQAKLLALDAGGVQQLAHTYLQGLRRVIARRGGRTEPSRVVDKLPDNYQLLGLISLMFPRATLIHVRRDLRDVAVSCWLTYFRNLRWADSQHDLARRCQDYARLMDHWRTVLPVTIHEVVYEELINDFEPQARRLVSACGLNWEPGCLQFHQTLRTVRTASVTQVRQPIYRSSLARWKAYEPFLATLFKQLPVG